MLLQEVCQELPTFPHSVRGLWGCYAHPPAACDPAFFPRARICAHDPKTRCCAKAVVESSVVHPRFAFQRACSGLSAAGFRCAENACGNIVRGPPGSVKRTSEEAGTDGQLVQEDSARACPRSAGVRGGVAGPCFGSRTNCQWPVTHAHEAWARHHRLQLKGSVPPG